MISEYCHWDIEGLKGVYCCVYKYCKVINILLLTSVTTSRVERANSSLRFVKDSFRSTTGEDRFNDLILLYE